jgi:hypothetical protein
MIQRLYNSSTARTRCTQQAVAARSVGDYCSARLRLATRTRLSEVDSDLDVDAGYAGGLVNQ